MALSFQLQRLCSTFSSALSSKQQRSSVEVVTVSDESFAYFNFPILVRFIILFHCFFSKETFLSLHLFSFVFWVVCAACSLDDFFPFQCCLCYNVGHGKSSIGVVVSIFTATSNFLQIPN